MFIIIYASNAGPACGSRFVERMFAPQQLLINTIGAGFPLVLVIGRSSIYSPIDIRKSGKTHMLQIAANCRSYGKANHITTINPGITSRGLSLHF
jgi:hypothetical protein